MGDVFMCLLARTRASPGSSLVGNKSKEQINHIFFKHSPNKRVLGLSEDFLDNMSSHTLLVITIALAALIEAFPKKSFVQKTPKSSSEQKLQEGYRMKIDDRFIYPGGDLQHLKCDTTNHKTVSQKTSPEDIQPIALGYDVWKADGWAESGIPTSILFTKTEA